MYSTHDEGKSVAAKRFIRMLKKKISKYMTSISKNVYTDKLDEIVMSMNLSDIAILNIKSADYWCIITGFSKNGAINLMQNADLNKKSGIIENIKTYYQNLL